MKEIEDGLKQCPHCGYKTGSKPDNKSHLPGGTMLGGRYMLGKVLGYGGFGITYIAWDKKLGRPVAIKEFFPNSLSTRTEGQSTVVCYDSKAEDYFRDGVKKMLDEGIRLSRFSDNENIVNIHDCFEENNTAYIVMEYLNGKDFKAYLAEKGGRLSPEEATEIVIPVLNALEDMHSERLIHRDISPDNIFICNNGKIKLLDFGSARLAVDDTDKSYSVMVKRGYAPKEQYASRSNQGPWTDVYAVCATLYKAITGEIPTESMDRDHKDLKSFSEFGIEGYDSLEAALFKGLEPEIADRIQSAAEMESILRKVMSGGNFVHEPPTKEIPEPVTTTEERKVRKEKKSIKKLAIVLAVLVGVITVLLAGIKFGKPLVEKLKDVPAGADSTQSEEKDDAAAPDEDAAKLYAEFIESDSFKENYPDYYAVKTKNASVGTESLKSRMENSGVEGLAKAVLKEEYFDIDSDGVSELLLTSDVAGEGSYLELLVLDIDSEGKVFEAGSFDNIYSGRLYNHISVMQLADGSVYFTVFSNDGNHSKSLEKLVYNGTEFVREFSLYALNPNQYEDEGNSDSVFLRYEGREKSLYGYLVSEDMHPAQGECEELTADVFAAEWELSFEGTHIMGFCDGYNEKTALLGKPVKSGSCGESATWALYESQGEADTYELIISGSGAIQDYSKGEWDEEFPGEISPWRETSGYIRLTVEEGITAIGRAAFYEASLISVRLPESLKKIGESAFGYSDIAAVTVPDGVTSIGDCAFSECEKLKKVSFGKNSSLTSIGEYAFSYSYDLVDITLPESVSVIGEGVFCSTSIKTAVLPKGINKIPQNLFSYCYELESVVIPGGVKEIGNWAFDGCESLTEMIIPDGVQTLGEGAFNYCTGLIQVTIPASVTSLYSSHYKDDEFFAGTFKGCTNLENIFVDDGNHNYSDIDGVLFEDDGTALIQYPAAKTNASYTVPSKVDRIWAYAFDNCTYLEYVTLPEGITTIGDGTFRDCTALRSVNIPSTVTTIGSSAFSGCTNISSINIPSSVTYINSWAFDYWTGSQKINIASNKTAVAAMGWAEDWDSGCDAKIEYAFGGLFDWAL